MIQERTELHEKHRKCRSSQPKSVSVIIAVGLCVAVSPGCSKRTTSRVRAPSEICLSSTWPVPARCTVLRAARAHTAIRRPTLIGDWTWPDNAPPVDAVYRRVYFREVLDCYREGLLQDPHLRGSVTIDLLLAHAREVMPAYDTGLGPYTRGGWVEEARLVSTNLADAPVECILSIAEEWHFAPPEGEESRQVRIELVLSVPRTTATSTP